jgi:hypothetical protein
VLLGKRLGDGYPAVPATAWVLTFGTLTLVSVALLWEGVPRPDLKLLGWASVLVLGCSAATYAMWNWGVARVLASHASHAGVFLNLEPLVGRCWGCWCLARRGVRGRSLAARSSSAPPWSSRAGVAREESARVGNAVLQWW